MALTVEFSEDLSVSFETSFSAHHAFVTKTLILLVLRWYSSSLEAFWMLSSRCSQT